MHESGGGHCRTCYDIVSRVVCSISYEYEQLLAYGSCRLGGTRGLNADDFNKVNDSAEVVLLKLFARQPFNLNRDGRVWLFLE